MPQMGPYSMMMVLMMSMFLFWSFVLSLIKVSLFMSMIDGEDNFSWSIF
uniref:ATP synthase F0 subunit 8 n=1 Tax=Setaphyes kielensis TaxID=3298910 RepID=A0A1I9VTS8_9BILA|nr:ATP synthase F0 subunit 8 [Pycnophyes kielensis]APA17401.1 ATP synthase F0 subunit 8 [Pycnophyes kielensis]